MLSRPARGVSGPRPCPEVRTSSWCKGARVRLGAVYDPTGTPQDTLTRDLPDAGHASGCRPARGGRAPSASAADGGRRRRHVLGHGARGRAQRRLQDLNELLTGAVACLRVDELDPRPRRRHHEASVSGPRRWGSGSTPSTDLLWLRPPRRGLDAQRAPHRGCGRASGGRSSIEGPRTGGSTMARGHHSRDTANAVRAALIPSPCTSTATGKRHAVPQSPNWYTLWKATAS